GVEPANYAEHFHLVFERQTVARFGFDRGRARSQKPFAVTLRRLEQFFFADRAGFADCRFDPATCRRNLLIALPRPPHFKFVGAVAGEDRVRVRVNETGHDDSTGGVNDLAISVNQLFDLAPRAGLNNAPVTKEHRAVADDRQITHLLLDARTARPGQRDKLG